MYIKTFVCVLVCILQSVTSGDSEWSLLSGCEKVERVVGSGASNIKTATDISLIVDILHQCSRLLSTRHQVPTSFRLLRAEEACDFILQWGGTAG